MDKSACLVAVHVETGLPLFIRSFNSSHQIPEVLLTSLGSVHSFCHSFSIDLIKTYAGEQVVWWSKFNQSIMLIMVMAGGEQDWMQRRLVTLLQHSILLTAPHDLLDGSYDSVKKALQGSVELVDSVLMEVLEGTCVSLISLTTPISLHHHSLQSRLDEFIKVSKLPPMAAIFVDGKRVVSSKKFTNHPPHINCLLQYYVCQTIHKKSSSTFSENIIYLPRSDHLEPVKLVTVVLCENVVLCVLANKSIFKDVINQSGKFWKSDMVGNIPPLPSLHLDILSYMVVSREKGTSITSSDDQGVRELTKFYQESASMQTASCTTSGMQIMTQSKCSIQGVYVCEGGHKCYNEVDLEGFDVWVIMQPSVPLYALKFAAREFVKKLTNMRNLCFSN